MARQANRAITFGLDSPNTKHLRVISLMLAIVIVFFGAFYLHFAWSRYEHMINDAYGHAEGDYLIAEVAKLINSCCRKDDMLARTGGDEFSEEVILICFRGGLIASMTKDYARCADCCKLLFAHCALFFGRCFPRQGPAFRARDYSQRRRCSVLRAHVRGGVG